MTDVNASARSTDTAGLAVLLPGAFATDNDRAKRQSYKAPDRVVPKSPRLLTQQVYSPIASQSPIALSSVSSDASPAVLLATEPTLKPHAADAATHTKSDSPEKNRIRSGSSPASISSPSAKPTQPQPVSPAYIPSLNLQALVRQPADDARSPTSSPIKSTTKSPTKLKSPRVNARVQISDGKAISTSAPSTPRKSPRPVGEYKPSSIRQSVKSLEKSWDPDIRPMPSPRKVDKALIALCDEVAELCFKHSKPVSSSTASDTSAKSPRDSDLKTLFRQDIKIPLEQMSPALRARLPADLKQDTMRHSELISLLFDTAFLKSPVGKALMATRKTVMDDYNDPSFTISETEAKLDTDPGFKQRLQLNMVDRAEAFADTAFGRGASHSAADQLSPELAALWKTMDRTLCELNPDRRNRERLAYALIMTQTVISKALSKNKNEAELVTLNVFVSAIKLACEKPFAKFVGRFIDAADAKRKTTSSTTSSGGGSVSTMNQDKSANT